MGKNFRVVLEHSIKRGTRDAVGMLGYVHVSRPEIVEKIILYNHISSTPMEFYCLDEKIVKALIYVNENVLTDSDFIIHRAYIMSNNMNQIFYNELLGKMPETPLYKCPRILGYAPYHKTYINNKLYRGEIVQAPNMEKCDVIEDNLEKYGISI